VLAGLLAAGAIAYAAFVLVRSVPAAIVTATQRPGVFPGRLALAWPGQGEAAVAVQGVGLIGAHGSARPAPIASIAKVMTAYVVLRDHPLRGSASGPQITVTRGDVAVYRADEASGQSVVLVQAGERLSERQALEALLLPSGNNIATLLARWDAGSEPAFVARMNAVGRALGLARTRYTSASGVKTSTVSTASDQVRLAMRALRVSALVQTVAMAQVTLPVAGPQYNRDTLLGRDGIFGVKPGTTAEAGGCFVFAARQRLDARVITVVGAVLGQAAGQSQPSMIASASSATMALLASTRRLLSQRLVLKRGATLAWVSAPWADPLALEAVRPVSLIGWPGLHIHTAIVRAGVHAPLESGQMVGAVVVTAGEQRDTVRLVTSRALPGASFIWRLTHP
jgi:D-alanyl-D-alanine carboxypeptidase (penicillin-binding protein 5/6)